MPRLQDYVQLDQVPAEDMDMAAQAARATLQARLKPVFVKYLVCHRSRGGVHCLPWTASTCSASISGLLQGKGAGSTNLQAGQEKAKIGSHLLVHGDFRAPNLMLQHTASGYRCQVIDFAWAGRHGVDRRDGIFNRMPQKV